MARTKQSARKKKQPKLKGSERREPQTFPNENAEFEKYYKSFDLVPDWPLFIKTLQTPLSTNFRFSGNRATGSELRDFMIKEYFPGIQNVRIDDAPVELPFALPWYPDGLGFQFNTKRTEIRKNPEIAQFQRFLVSETEAGNMSRQEAVSMIPPLVLDVEPHHVVLDMCAAPGSKTGQLIEALHKNDSVDGTVPCGIVIANDSDYSRCYTLVKQCKRLQSPCTLVTCHEAQFFPFLFTNNQETGKQAPLLFDRILADVPCSGDGTLRKNIKIWRNWNAHAANNLHKLQLSILLHGIRMLKVGGRIVYSTCSFNPGTSSIISQSLLVENEAVVAEALKVCGGAIRLVDCSDRLQGLIRRPGITHWTVGSKQGEIFTEYSQVPPEKRGSIVESCFPPSNASELGLEKCMRIRPEDNNTGGFFITVFEKVSSYGSMDSKAERDIPEAVVEEEQQPSAPKHVSKKRKVSSYRKEADFFFLDKDNDSIKVLDAQFGIPKNFPLDQFVTRSESETKSHVYFANTMVKKVIEARNSFKLKIVNSGVKLFSRCVGKAFADREEYRLCAEGTRTLCIEKRRVYGTMDDLIVMLREQNPLLGCFSKAVQESFAPGNGSYLLIVDPSSQEGLLAKQVMHLPVWKSRASLSLLIDQQECRALLHRLTGEFKERTQSLEKDKKTANDEVPPKAEQSLENDEKMANVEVPQKAEQSLEKDHKTADDEVPPKAEQSESISPTKKE